MNTSPDFKPPEFNIYETTFERANVGIAHTSADGRWLQVNPALCGLLGYTREELLALSPAAVVLPEDLPDVQAAHVQLISGETDDLTLEKRHLRKDGSLLWVRAHLSAVRDEKGAFRFTIIVVEDITAERAAIEQRLERETFITAVTSAVPDVLYVYDLSEDRNVWSNRATLEVLGYSPEQIVALGTRILPTLIHPDDLAAMGDYRAKFSSLADGASVEDEYRMRNAAGEWYWVLSREQVFTRNPDGTPRQVVGMAQDISERKQTERDLQESEARYRALISASFDVVYRMSPDWREMRQLYGRAFIPDTLDPSSTWLDLYIHPEDQAHVLGVINEAIRTKGVFELEHRVRRVDGSFGWTLSRAVPLLDEEGEITEWVGTATDITERRQAEAALRESEARLHNILSYLPGAAIFIVDQNLRYQMAQGEALHNVGFQPADFIGKTISQMLSPDLLAVAEPLYRAALAGTLHTLEHEQGGFAFVSRFAPMRGENGQIEAVVAISYDITARKQAEAQTQRMAERDTFRVALNDALRPLSDPVAIQREATRVLGEHLKADRVLYGEVGEDGNSMTIAADYLVGDMPSVVGQHQFNQFGAYVAATLREGRTLVIPDVSQVGELTDEERASYRAIQVVAYAAVPLVKADRLLAFLAVNHRVLHAWTTEEISLIEETAERTWAALERARAETALRESEEKYRTLFESISEGFALCEMLRDEGGQFVHNYRYLELNPAFERLTGLRAADARDNDSNTVLPGLDSWWYETYTRVVQTGQTQQFERFVPQLDRWYYVSAFPAGGDRFAVLYSDISERKKTEEALRVSAARAAFRNWLIDALRPLDDPVAIQGAATRVLGEYLNVGRVLYGEFDVEGDPVRVAANYLAEGVESAVGQYQFDDYGVLFTTAMQEGRTLVIPDVGQVEALTEGERASYEAIQVVAYAAVPLIKAGRLLALLAVHALTPRAWTADEITLIEETAERTWAAVERARAEADLHESEAQLQLALDATGLGTWDWNLSTGEVRVNPRLREIYGLPPGDSPLTVASVLPQLHSDDLEAARTTLQAAQHPVTGGRYDVEYRIITPGGGVRWVWAHGVVSFEGEGEIRQATRIIGTVQDITERKEREAERERLADAVEFERARFEAVAQQMPAALAIAEPPSGRVVFANAQLNDMYEGQFPPAENVADYVTWGFLHHSEDNPYTAEEMPLARALRGETVREEYMDWVSPDGVRVILLTSGTPIRNAGGQITAAVAIANDVTELEHAHERERQQQAEEAVRESRQRLARDLHDAVSQTLFSATLLTDTLPNVWQNMPPALHEQIATLRMLTHGALAEMRTLLLELRPEHLPNINLEEQLKQLADAMRARKNVEVTFTISDGVLLPPEVRIAFYRIAQEAMNNIIKHARARHVQIDYTTKPAGAQLVITDDGVGIANRPRKAAAPLKETDTQEMPTPRLGVQGMQERALEIDAALHITSADDPTPGRGTRVELRWQNPSAP